MRICDDLRQAVLQAAIQGKLTKQLPEDGNAADLLKQIIAEKAQLIKEGKIKKEKPLPEITPDEVPFDIPDNWEWANLQSISKLITDGEHKTPKRISSFKGYYLLSARNVVDGRIKLDNVDYVDEEEFQRISKRCNPIKNDILISCSGSVGRIAVVTDNNLYVMVRSAAMVRLLHMNSKFVMYALQSHWLQSQISKLTKQTAQANLFQGAIIQLVVPIPPLAEQQRIVARVEELMARIDDLEKTETELEKLKAAFPGDMKAALLQAAMQGKLTEQLPEDGDAADLINQIAKEKSQLIKEGKIKKEKTLPEITPDEVPFDIPGNWRWSILGDIAEMYTGNSISETEKAKKYTDLDKGYDYIGTKDIGFDGNIKYDNGVKIPFDNDKFRNAYPDATLLCIEGGSAGRKIAMLNKKVCFGNKLCMFYSDMLNKKFLYYYLQCPDFLDAFKNNVSGIIGGVSIKKLKSMLIPVPPLAEQKRIVEKLDKLLPLCDGLIEE